MLLTLTVLTLSLHLIFTVFNIKNTASLLSHWLENSPHYFCIHKRVLCTTTKFKKVYKSNIKSRFIMQHHDNIITILLYLLLTLLLAVLLTLIVLTLYLHLYFYVFIHKNTAALLLYSQKCALHYN